MAAAVALQNLRAATEHLPPELRFSPTDQEAVEIYLKQGRGFYRGVTVIPQIDICKWEPIDLPTQFKNMSIVPSRDLDGWFLCKNEPGRNAIRSTKGGYWKITGRSIPVKDKYSSQLIANKKFLTFYMKGHGSDTKTSWVMHEYDLPEGHVRDLVLCHVMLKSETVLDLMDDIMDYPSSEEDLIQINIRSFEEDLAQATMESLRTARNHGANSWLVEEEDTLLSEAESGFTFIGHSFGETGGSSGMDFSFTSDSVDQYEYHARERAVIREISQNRCTDSIEEVLPIDEIELEGLVEVTKKSSSRRVASKMEGYGENSLQTPNRKPPPVAKRSAKIETTSPGTAQAKEDHVAAAADNMIKKKHVKMPNLNVIGGEKSCRETMRTSKTASSSCSNCYNRECCCSNNPPGLDFFNLFVGVLIFVLFCSWIF